MSDNRRITKLMYYILPVVLFVLHASLVVKAEELLTGRHMNLKTENHLPFKVYVSGPENAKRGILLVHGWLGLNKDIKALTNEFATTGYRAMAIDLYDGKTASNPKDAKKLMESVKQSLANSKYLAALKALAAPGRKLAVIGWSFGGSQALRATLTAPDLVSATVSYYPYGKMVSDKKILSRLQGPILIQVGDKDFAFTPKKIQEFQKAVKNAGKIAEINIYDAKHGFDKKLNKNYNEFASKRADKTTREFLDRNLK